MGKIINKQELFMRDPIRELRIMIGKNMCYGKYLELDSAEKLLNVLDFIGVDTDVYIEMFKNVVINYKKLDNKAFVNGISKSINDIGYTMMDQNRDLIEDYLRLLEEGAYAKDKEAFKQIKELLKIRNTKKEERDLRRGVIPVQLMLTASILLAGYGFGPTLSKYAAISNYAIERDIETGEENQINISSGEFNGDEYVRKYGEVFFDSVDKQYYRDVVDYHYTTPFVTNDSPNNLDDKFRFGSDEKEIEEKVGRKLDFYKGHVESVANPDDAKGERIVFGRQMQSMDEKKAKSLEFLYKTIADILALLVGSSVIVSLYKNREYPASDRECQSAINTYGRDQYNKEVKEIREVKNY